MRFAKVICLVGGAALFALLLANTDIDAVVGQLRYLGWGFLGVLVIYGVAFLLDNMTWHLALDPLPLTASWFYRLWKVRMVGEAFNDILPMGGLGGEPIKAVLAMRTLGFDAHTTTASLVLARTINTLALLPFLAFGFVLVLDTESLPPSLKWLSGAGLGLLCIGIAALFALQRLQVTTRVSTRLFGHSLAVRLQRALGHIREVDGRLAHFYQRKWRQFYAAILCGVLNWCMGAAEIYFTMRLLGHSTSLSDAVIIETVTQLVRVAFFFIPAGIGVQDGAFVFITDLLIGRPDAGLAMALVRRLRQIVWIAWGLIIGVALRDRKVEGA